MELKELAKRSNDFVSKINLYKELAVRYSEKILLEINKSQLSFSTLSTGQIIAPPYSPSYARYKGFKNPNLQDTGDFKKAMFLNVKGVEYIISSTDWKTALLINKYSAYIFGIFNKPLAMDATSEQLAKLYKENVL